MDRSICANAARILGNISNARSFEYLKKVLCEMLVTSPVERLMTLDVRPLQFADRDRTYRALKNRSLGYQRKPRARAITRETPRNLARDLVFLAGLQSQEQKKKSGRAHVDRAHEGQVRLDTTTRTSFLAFMILRGEGGVLASSLTEYTRVSVVERERSSLDDISFFFLFNPVLLFRSADNRSLLYGQYRNTSALVRCKKKETLRVRKEKR